MATPSSLFDSLVEWGRLVDKNLPPALAFSGVVTRRGYLLGLFLVAIPAMVLITLEMAWSVQVALSLPLVFVTASLVIRRLRDVNKPLALAFWGLLPVAGWVVLATVTAGPTPDNALRRSASSRVLPGLAVFSALLLVGSSTLAITDESVRNNASTVVVEQGVQDSLATEGQLESDATGPEDVGSASPEAGSLAGGEEELQQEEVEPPETPSLQTPPSGGGLDDLVGSLVVQEEFSGGYDRSLFRHWVDANGNGCDTRREVLIAESLTPVRVGSACSISGGTWYSAFDGVTTNDPSDFDIDHFVPLKEAWDSGAHAWDSGTRQRFANDLDFPGSLIAVSAQSNRSKGASDPAEWLPPNADYLCTYLITWVQVKIRWNLSADPREVQAIRQAGASC
jgi:uncharacterized membrane protein YhaH (DUF805 family)